MKKFAAIALGSAALLAVAAALAQTVPAPSAAPAAQPNAQPGDPAADVPPLPTSAVVPPTATPVGPPAHAVLELRALDKITGRASIILAPLNKTVKFASLEITARTCYSTPPSETPETSAFLQIDDHRADQSQGRRAFSGWMYASSPGLNSLQHPLYDVWVISCNASSPGQAPAVIAAAPVKVLSPNAGANEAMPALPEDAGQ